MTSTPRSESYYSIPPSIADAPETPGGLGARLSNTISSYLFESVLSIQASPARLPTDKRKTPLSLPQTTANFRQFVQKSGPLFYFQDAVEATLLWDDWSWTVMWMGIWAVIALYPYLLLCAPSFVLCIILLKTHQARFPLMHASAPAPRGASSANDVGHGAEEASTARTVPDDRTAAGVAQPARQPRPADALRHSLLYPSSIGEGSVRPPLVPQPPTEGSIRYLANLRDIQNMMKMIPDGYDAIVPVVPYLNWSSYNRTLLLLQASIVATVAMFFLGPLLPLRLILLVGGEALFLATHPWVEPVVHAIGSLRASSTPGGKRSEQLRSVVRKRRKEASHRLREWLELDRLDDQVFEHGWREVEMFENERFYGTIDAAASGAVAPAAAAGTLRQGWSAANLRPGERRSWTRGADGWTPDSAHHQRERSHSGAAAGAGASIEGTGYVLDRRALSGALEKGWAWVEGDDWRIDWGGEWSAVGVDDEGYVFTDADWQRPAPFAYGHPHQPAYPVLPPELPGAAAGDGGEKRKRETDGHSFPAAALSSGAKAMTRRRRWLRRAVRVQ